MPDYGLGLGSTPPPQTPSPSPTGGMGGPSPQAALGLGAGPQDQGSPAGQSYDSLFNDASQYYLGHGGTQANVDAYKVANPQRDYGRLFNDAGTWFSQQPEYLNGSMGTAISDYFAANNPPGSPYNQMIGINTPAQNPLGGVQPQKPYPGALGDPSMAIHAGQPTQPGLGGAPPTQPTREGMPPLGLGAPPANPPLGGGPPAPSGGGPPLPVSAAPPIHPPAQIGNYNNTLGGPGSLQNAMADPGDYWRAHRNDSQSPGATDNGFAANQGPNSPGGGGSGDPWTQPAIYPNGQLATQGYARGAPQTIPQGQWGAGQTTSPIVKWDQPGGPAPSLTQGGQDTLNQPFQAGGQPFTGLQGLLDFMAQSSTPQQALKGQMEQKDEQGGSLEPGEKTLFDKFAQYLGQKTNAPPTGATPFTNWDPVGLLTLLKQAGIIGG